MFVCCSIPKFDPKKLFICCKTDLFVKLSINEMLWGGGGGGGDMSIFECF